MLGSMSQKTIRERLEQALDEVRFLLAAHGGSVELVAVDEIQGIATVRLTGACEGCAFADQTLQSIVESVVTESVPEIKTVCSEGFFGAFPLDSQGRDPV